MASASALVTMSSGGVVGRWPMMPCSQVGSFAPQAMPAIQNG